jgi:hypothetical protein
MFGRQPGVRSALQANLLFRGRASASRARATTSTAQRALGATQLVSGSKMCIDLSATYDLSVDLENI